MTDLRASVPGFDHLFSGGKIPGKRPYQEDHFETIVFEGDPDGSDLLMVLADGMGGHLGGAQASGLAVSTVVEEFLRATGGVTARLRASLDAANAEVGRSAVDPRYAGMGCTLVVCVVTEDETAHWISVGDSPLWRLPVGDEGQAGGLERLNADHSMRPIVEDLVRLGRMTPDEAAKGGANQLRSAVTGEELTLVDAGSVRLGVGDRVLLASDGLETLRDEEIVRLSAGRRTSAEIVRDLLGAVEARGSPSQDNATVVVYQHVEAAVFRRRFEVLTAPTRPVVRRSWRQRLLQTGQEGS